MCIIKSNCFYTARDRSSRVELQELLWLGLQCLSVVVQGNQCVVVVQLEFSIPVICVCWQGQPVVICETGDSETELMATQYLGVPHYVDCLQGLLTVIPLQLLSLRIAELRNLDVSPAWLQWLLQCWHGYCNADMVTAMLTWLLQCWYGVYRCHYSFMESECSRTFGILPWLLWNVGCGDKNYVWWYIVSLRDGLLPQILENVVFLSPCGCLVKWWYPAGSFGCWAKWPEVLVECRWVGCWLTGGQLRTACWLSLADGCQVVDPNGWSNGGHWLPLCGEWCLL